MLLTSILFFSQNVFYYYKDKATLTLYFESACSWKKSKILSSWKMLNENLIVLDYNF